MKYWLFTFRSVTHAQRGESVLRRAGYRCGLGRTPRWMEEQGCGYSVMVRAMDASVAEYLLRSNVPFRKLYCSTDKGQWEEVT